MIHVLKKQAELTGLYQHESIFWLIGLMLSKHELLVVFEGYTFEIKNSQWAKGLRPKPIVRSIEGTVDTSSYALG